MGELESDGGAQLCLFDTRGQARSWGTGQGGFQRARLVQSSETLGRMAPHPVIPRDERNLLLTAKNQLANASYVAWKLTR